MPSARGVTRVVLVGLGVLLVAGAANVLQSVETPPGGGDIPGGFAVLFAYLLGFVGLGLFAAGVLLLDDTGVGAYFSTRQRQVVRVGGALLGLAALAPVLAVFALPLLLGAAGPGASGGLLPALALGWLALLALGTVGVLGGVLWCIGEVVYARFRQSG